MADTLTNVKTTLSGNRAIRICGTRALKNARAIRKAAPHLIPPKEPLEGFRSLVPLDILRRFHGVSEQALASFPELLKVKRQLIGRRRTHPIPSCSATLLSKAPCTSFR